MSRITGQGQLLQGQYFSVLADVNHSTRQVGRMLVVDSTGLSYRWADVTAVVEESLAALLASKENTGVAATLLSGHDEDVAAHPTLQQAIADRSQFLGNVANEAAMLALTGAAGDTCYRTDNQRLFTLKADDASQLGNWVVSLTAGDVVTSVNGEFGDVTLAAADVGAAAEVHGHIIDDVSGLSSALAGKAAASHGHAVADVTGLQSALDGKAAASHGHAISDVTSLQTALDGKAATAHSHAVADVTGLQAALDGKSATGHGHAIADVTGLQTAMDGKAAATHSHAIADVAGLQSALDGKAASNHTHTVSDVTDLPTIAKSSTGNALVQANATGTINDSFLPTYLAKVNSGNTFTKQQTFTVDNSNITSVWESTFGTKYAVLDIKAGDGANIRVAGFRLIDTSTGANGRRWEFRKGDSNEFSAWYFSETGASVRPFMLEAGTPANAFVVKADGKVGIGTASPSAMLTVAGDAAVNGNMSVNGTDASALRIARNGSAISYLEIIDAQPQRMQIRKVAGDSTEAVIDIDPMPANGTSPALFRFFRETNTTGLTSFEIHRGNGALGVNTRLAGNSSTWLNLLVGNVGIGTHSPTSKLHVSPGADVVANVVTGPLLQVTNAFPGGVGTADDYRDGIIGIGAGGGLSHVYLCGGGSFANNSSGHFAIQLRASEGTYNTRFYIDTAGRVGIGTTTPSALLTVAGTSRLEGECNVTGNLYTDSNGSSAASPREIGNTAVVGSRSRVLVAGASNSIQSGHGCIMQIASWFRLDISGDRLATAPSFATADGSENIGTRIFSTRAASRPLVVQGTTSQTANLQEWRNDIGTVLTSISAAGHLGLGAAANATAKLYVAGHMRVVPGNGLEVATSNSGLVVKNSGAGGLAFAVGSSNNDATIGGGKLLFSIDGAPSVAAQLVLVGASGNFGVGDTNPAEKLSVNGNIVTTTGLFVRNGYIVGGTTTDTSNKELRIALNHYLAAEEAVTGLRITTTNGANLVQIGGGSGTQNAATTIAFNCAANSTTLIGSQVGWFNSGGLTVQPTAGGVNAAIRALHDGGFSARFENTGTGGGYYNWVATNSAYGTGGGRLLLLDNGTTTTGAVLTLMSGLFGFGSGNFTPTAVIDIASDTMRLRTAKTPTSSTATSNQGDRHWDASYEYRATAANTYQRVGRYACSSPAQLTANVNNWNPGSARNWRVSSNAARDITGIATGQWDGDEHRLINVGANSVTLKHQNTGSTDVNRVICATGADIVLAPNEIAVVVYDAVTQRWRAYKG